MVKLAFSNIIRAGLQHEMPSYLQKRIQPTNIIALLIAIAIGVPFVIITSIYFPRLVVYPAVGGLICLGCVGLNHIGSIQISRLLISIIPISLGAVYNAYLSNPDEDPLPCLYLIELSFALIPFVIYDFKEKAYIIFTTLICAAIILSFPITKMWVNSGYDSTILRSGWLGSLTICIAIISEFGSVLGLVFISKQVEKESEILRQEAVGQQEQLQAEKQQREADLVKLKEAQSTEQKRQWTAEGIAGLADILRSNLEDKEMYDRVVAMVVKYLKANQGGLYVVNREEETDVTIELAACYAYGRKKYLEQTFAPGHGLLGQAYLEGESIYMTAIPQEYVKITSGLGEATPTALLIVPLKVNDSIEGILEMASFKKLEQYEIDFIKKLGESIASHIQNSRVNSRTKVLLAQARQQAEELKAQEEEMRQNMEELAATQEEMQRKEQEYQRLIQELEGKLAATH